MDSGKNREALGEQFAELYTELRDLAGKIWRSNPSATLHRTALLNEAFVRLSRSDTARPTDPREFKRLAASVMRRVLIDAARRRQSLKRGEGWVAVTADSVPDPRVDDLERLLAVDQALERLAAQLQRSAKLVELRFFAGMEVNEAAETRVIDPNTRRCEPRAEPSPDPDRRIILGDSGSG